MIASDPIRTPHPAKLLQAGGRPHMGPRFRGNERLSLPNIIYSFQREKRASTSRTISLSAMAIRASVKTSAISAAGLNVSE
jgi:hypothetical protein